MDYSTIYGGLLMIGIFMALAVYHLFIFMGRKNDRGNLAFSFFCITYSIIVFLNSIYRVQPNSSFYLYQIFHTSASVIFALVFIIFGNTIFKLEAIKKLIFFYYIFIPAIGVFTILGFAIFKNILFIQSTFFVFSILQVIYSILLFWHLVVQGNLKSKKEKIIFTGYLVLSVFIVFYCVERALMIETNLVIIRIFFLLMALFFAYALADSFNKEHADLIELTETLESKVKERTRELNEAKMQKETFFINIAHEIKTPLTIVLHQFQEYEKKHESTEELFYIRSSLEKLKRDILYFLDLNKLEKGLIQYDHNQIVELRELIKNKASQFRRHAVFKKLQISFNTGNEDVYIHIDPIAIDCILNNLLENAIKYNKPHGKIHMEISSASDIASISISDTGIGINKEALPHIFEPYYQASRNKLNIEGMGMGLAIIKGILDTLKAPINVSGNVNEGTTFTLHFKRYYPTPEEIFPARSMVDTKTASEQMIYLSHAELPTPAFIPGNKTILLVEDNMELLRVLISSLSPLYNVYYAFNGKDALKKLASQDKPDLIISDIMMDEMDGIKFREQLLKQPEFAVIPFIFLSAKTARNDILKGLEKGAVDYISKPFEMDELLLKISSLIKITAAMRDENLNQIHVKLNTHLASVRNESHQKAKLSSQEIKVISMLHEGLLYKEIAEKMNISLGTVQTYIKRIYKKMSIHCAEELFDILDQK